MNGSNGLKCKPKYKIGDILQYDNEDDDADYLVIAIEWREEGGDPTKCPDIYEDQWWYYTAKMGEASNVEWDPECEYIPSPNW